MALKERTGSSQYAIAKFIEENQKEFPSNFKKLLLVQLKKLVSSGKLTKVKNSFKLSGNISNPTKVAVKAKKEAPKKVFAAPGKPKNAAKKEASKKTGEEKGKKRRAAAAPAKVKKTPLKKLKAKSIKSPAKKLKK